MSTGLHTTKPNTGSKKKRKVIGRGNASGHGTYSTKGMKGQKARSGGRGGLKKKGWRHLLLSMPKLRGFKSLQAKKESVNVGDLEKVFKNLDKVNPQTLFASGLVEKSQKVVKILGSGDLTKKLEFSRCLVSAGARAKIEKAGGSIN